MSFIRPFTDAKTGLRRPALHAMRTFVYQFPLIPLAFFAALYSSMQDPDIVRMLGVKPDFWNWNHYKLFFDLRDQMISSGHPLPVDPMYFAIGASSMKLFWAFFEPASDAIQKLGKRFNVYTQRLGIPYQWNIFIQNFLSAGDLLVVLFGYEMSRYYSGVEIPIAHKVGATLLVTLAGCFAKSLPKTLLLNLQEAGIIGVHGQDIGNGIINTTLSTAKTVKVVRAGGPLDPYYWFAYAGVFYAAHTVALNKSEFYRQTFRMIETSWSKVYNRVGYTASKAGPCLLQLSQSF